MLYIILYLFSLIHPAEKHPFFVSVIEAEYYKKQNMVGISCKIFNDDLETSLKKFSGQPVDIINGEKNANKQKMASYFPQHLKVKINGKPINYEVLGYENEKDAVFVYLELKGTDEPRKFEIETNLLYELDKSQVNLVHFIKNGERQTQRLTYPNTSAIFE
ncbi:MAG TPA: DUF6702 family protein [Chitinophagaceae bacterium]|nr:DUF6702 family protein [Chitinophagaceae bacterium]